MGLIPKVKIIETANKSDACAWYVAMEEKRISTCLKGRNGNLSEHHTRRYDCASETPFSHRTKYSECHLSLSISPMTWTHVSRATSVQRLTSGRCFLPAVASSVQCDLFSSI